jgi:steroid delta-isomerase-like uncharacterized protein
MKKLLMVIPLVFLFCFTFGCQQSEEVAEEVKAELDLKPIADKLIEVFNTQDAAALAQLYTEDQVTICSGVPEPVRGRKAKEEFVGGFFTAFPDMNMEPTSVLFADNHIIFEVIMRGTNDGPLEGGIPATGRSVEFKLIFVTRVSDEGLIEEDRTYFDWLGLMTQLGMELKPKEEK